MSAGVSLGLLFLVMGALLVARYRYDVRFGNLGQPDSKAPEIDAPSSADDVAFRNTLRATDLRTYQASCVVLTLTTCAAVLLASYTIKSAVDSKELLNILGAISGSTFSAFVTFSASKFYQIARASAREWRSSSDSDPRHSSG